MNAAQKVVLGISLLVCAGMAYFLQDIILALLFEPLAYALYMLQLFYLSVAQSVYWFLLVVLVALIAFGSLYGRLEGTRPAEEGIETRRGPVETTARYITRSGEGIYYKWLVANRLGRLARAMLVLRSGRDDGNYELQEQPGWQPSTEVQAYLQAGLQKAFTDFPSRRWFRAPPATPFDIDLERVVTFLETRLEDQHD